MQELSQTKSHGSHEGVIQFQLDFIKDPTIPAGLYEALNACRQSLYQKELTGQDPLRYGGLAYGNFSQRCKLGGFLISGTQTGGRAHLGANDYTWVQAWDIGSNQLRAKGPCRPSSEALTHAAAYQANPEISAVLHVHSPILWRNAHRLGISLTDPQIGYGTPEMAKAIEGLVRQDPLALIVMGGHEDGIIATGPTLERTRELLLGALNAAESLGPKA